MAPTNIKAPPMRFNALPVDILTEIRGRTTGGTVLALSCTNKDFYSVARNDAVWKGLHDRGHWQPTEAVVPIVKAGAFRDAYQVQVMETKLDWDKLASDARALDDAAQDLGRRVPMGHRGGCVLSAPTNMRDRMRLIQGAQRKRVEQKALQQMLAQEHLSVTDKGWQRRWG